MKATPRVTARAVANSRSLWAISPWMVVVNTAASLPEPLHPLEDLLGRRVEHLVHDATVREEHDPIRVAGGGRVVGHHDDRLAHVVDGAPHEREHLGAGFRVQVP